MYTAQLLSERIKRQAKLKDIKLKDMLIELDLNINTIKSNYRQKRVSMFSFGRIADYLDCSVDYLLGRTDNPEVNK